MKDVSVFLNVLDHSVDFVDQGVMDVDLVADSTVISMRRVVVFWKEDEELWTCVSFGGEGRNPGHLARGG